MKSMEDLTVPIGADYAELREKLEKLESKLSLEGIRAASEIVEQLRPFVNMLMLAQVNPSLARAAANAEYKKAKFDAYKAAREHDSWHYEEHDFGTLEIPYVPWWKRAWWRGLDAWDWMKGKVGHAFGREA